VADASAHHGEARMDPADPRSGYDAGDALLRYIANVGADGNPDPSAGPDPCQSVTPPPLTPQPDPALPTLPGGDLSYNCGNYFFALSGWDVITAAQSLSARIWPGALVTPTATLTATPTLTPTSTPTQTP
jgi:hypothetical protein